MKRRNFIKYSSICLGASAFGYLGDRLLRNESFKSFYRDKLNIFKFIEIHLTEHCNLNCKYCSHFAPIAKEHYYDVKQYEKDIEALSNALKGGSLHSLQLLGGEPLMHPKINDLVKITRKYLPNTNIDILTNATLLNSMDSTFWNTLVENNIVICPSIYPISLNWSSILSKAEKYGVKIMNDGRNHKIGQKDLSHPKEFFYKIKLDLEGKQNTSRPECGFKTVCDYKNGKFYRCFVAANIEHFNNKFGTDLKVTEDDYIDIYKINNIKEMIEIYKSWDNNYSFCKYCKGVFGYEKWECSNEHYISEWT